MILENKGFRKLYFKVDLLGNFFCQIIMFQFSLLVQWSPITRGPCPIHRTNFRRHRWYKPALPIQVRFYMKTSILKLRSRKSYFCNWKVQQA